jgi:hypothetical protein
MDERSVVARGIRPLPDHSHGRRGRPNQDRDCGDATTSALVVTIQGRYDRLVAISAFHLHRRAFPLALRDLHYSAWNIVHHGTSDRPHLKVQEGVALIRKSVEVNTEAHFGREQWQAAIAEFLLATLDDPVLLKTYDCLGNRLDLAIEDILNRETNWTSTGYGRPYDPAFSQGVVDNLVPAFFTPGIALDEASRWPEVSPIRLHITTVGAEPGWEDVAVPSIAMSFLSWLRSGPQSSTDSKEPASRGSGSPTDSARADKPLEGRLASG